MTQREWRDEVQEGPWDLFENKNCSGCAYAQRQYQSRVSPAQHLACFCRSSFHLLLPSPLGKHVASCLAERSLLFLALSLGCHHLYERECQQRHLFQPQPLFTGRFSLLSQCVHRGRLSFWKQLYSLLYSHLQTHGSVFLFQLCHPLHRL